MNITLNNQEIKKPLDLVKGGIENNSNHQILSYVLIKTKNQKLILTTTNSEIEIEVTNTIKPTQEVEFTICLIDLNNIIAKLDENTDINFLIEKEQITITAEKNKFKVNTIQNNKFHKLIINNEIIEKFKVNKNQIFDIINKTKFSIANNKPQQYLNGLFLSITKEKILTVSSDGHRLSLAQNKIKNNTIEDKNSIIPKKTIDEIIKLLTETKDKEINIGINDNYIIISTTTTTITSKLIDGNYPDYQQIMPNKTQNNILIKKKSFEQALKQAEIFTKETKTIQLIFEDNQLTITAESEKGNAITKLTTNNFKGKLTISFNVSYLIQTLQILETKNILFNIDNDDPKIVVLTNENNENYKYLIMSIKV